MGEMTGAAATSRAVAASKINFGRVIACGVLTGLICCLLKALLEEPFFDRPFFAALQNAGSPVHHELPATFIAFAVTATFAVSIYAMWLYAAILPRYGSGAKTAIIAGFAVWLLIAMTDSVWASFRLMPVKPLLPVVLCALPEIVIALLVGARFYSE